ncbi:MAG: helix-turn-helix transcriptional regulator [Oscillospiraceae bacterium]|nr:helix-turn-helix transcriptional regulator [Oscillospiraceae bacterium]
MGIYYYKLNDLLNRRGLKKGDLIKMAEISNVTVSKLSSNKVVQTDMIDKVCKALNCQPGDIMEYIPDEDKEGER